MLRRAERGKAARNTIRPRGIFGLIRSRGPLSIILYAAARDGLLVWRGVDAFAVLDPPHGERYVGRPGGLARHLDRRWEFVLFFGPPTVLLVLMAAMVPLVLLWQWAPAVLIALILGLMVMLHVLLLMGAMLVTAIGRWLLGLPVRRRRDMSVAEDMRFRHWSLPLCHCADPAAAPALLDQVTERLRGLVRSQIRQAIKGMGARTETHEVNEPLLCLLDGATTSTMREAVEAAAAGGSVGGVTFLATGSRSAVRPQQIVSLAPGLGLYVIGVGIVVAIEAYVLAGWEEEACAPDCAGRPATFGTALRWLAWRLIGGDPADLVPATSQAWTVGWLTTLMGGVTVLFCLVAMWQAPKVHRQRLNSFLEGMDPVIGTTTVLIMVATPEEKQAVIEAVTEATGAQPGHRNLKFHTAFELGVVSRARVLVSQSRPASADPGGAVLAAQSLIDQLDPDYLLLTGICFGLREDKQRLGDILVCSQLRVTDHKKIVEPVPGEPVEIPRGDRVAPSVTLLDRCQNARLPREEPKVHYGPMLSGNVLLDSPTARRRMIEAEPDAIGGEMEGHGVYAAAAKGKVDWIVVKAICDWGMGKTDDWHERAARNAAEFVLDVLRQGGLDRPPGQA